MKLHVLALVSVLAAQASAFQGWNHLPTEKASAAASSSSSTRLEMDRRNFAQSVVGAAAAASFGLLGGANAASAEVYFDPAMYGDQELRVGTVDTVRERARRAILQNPALAPAFYQLAILDGLSYDAASSKYGPNGNVVFSVLNSKIDTQYVKNLQGACAVLIQAEKDLKKKTAVSIADCIAIAGAESIESIGGPVLPVQLGRLEVDKSKLQLSSLPIDLFSGDRKPAEIRNAFRSAGLTDREMTALLSGLLTLERIEKTRTTDDWKESVKPKFVERGKMGRMSDYKRLTDEDIIAAASDEFDEDPDDGWYIADSFGSRDDRFGQRIAKDEINEKNFNKFVKDMADFYLKKKGSDEFGWIGKTVFDPEAPAAQSWAKKYADSNLSYTKDLGVAFNSITQLGAVYTGGKYENLLKNRPRKSLNDDDLGIF
jgi:hypothetical protein